MIEKYLTGFTLVELLVTMTIIVLMALISIPSFNKYQDLVELQNKSGEIKAGLDEMQVSALNAGQGITRYYAKLTAGSPGKVEFYNITSLAPYKTVNLVSDQTLTKIAPDDYLVCEKGKSYCCITPTEASVCTSMITTDFFSLANESKTTTFTIWSNPFRVITATN